MIKLKDLLNANLQEGNESATHIRLKKKLSNYAQEHGYIHKYVGDFNGKEPDVLQYDNNSYLFVGDAKVAQNETVGRAETAKQISGYIDILLKLIEDETFNGGVIAIITDDKKAVKEWKDWLSLECSKKGCPHIGTIPAQKLSFNENIALVSIISK